MHQDQRNTIKGGCYSYACRADSEGQHTETCYSYAHRNDRGGKERNDKHGKHAKFGIPGKMPLPPMPKFAPLNVPFPRRRQTASVLLWMILVPLCIGLFLEMLLASYITRTIALVYYLYVMQDKGYERGARRSQWLRSLPVWVWMADFFPINLMKEADLDPSKKYIFAYHPHGVISMGAFLTIATEARDISKVHPGLNIRLMTLEANYRVPFWRDLILFFNICSADKKSFQYLFGSPKSKPGDSCMVVTGGAAESMEAFPGTNRLILKNRLGFVKMALTYGACLVPTYGFGENDIWDQVPNPKGSFVRKFQTIFKDIATFSPILFHGRGIFTYDYGIMPYRKPITVVTGVPIQCPKMDKITEADLREWHAKYLEGLQILFDKHKDALMPNRKEDLVIM